MDGEEELAAGERALARGAYYEAHEHWEAAWNASDGDERRWIQGMIQIVTALYKLEGARADLACSLLTKGLAKLAAAAPPSLARLGWDLERFRRDAANLLAALERGESPSPSTLRLHLAAARA